MEHIVTGIVAFASAHTLLAYGLAFALAGAESFPVVGAAVPGTATIIALGALVPSDALQLWPLITATTLGAIVGDGVSYWLGHHYRSAVAAMWPLRNRPTLLARGNAFFARHGSAAILFARFTPGVRAVVPLAAGVTGMNIARFYAVNILSALLWGPSHVAMGALLGASLEILGAIAGRLAVLVVGVFLVLVLMIWLTARTVRLLSDVTVRLQGPVRDWVGQKDTWLRRQIGSLLDPERAEVPGLIALGALLVGGLWLFFGVLQDVIAGDPLVRANLAVFQLLQSVRVAAVDRIMVAVTELGDASVTVPVAVVVLIWLAWHRAWRAALYGTAAVAGAGLFVLLLKLTVRQVRPGALYAGWNAFSFPSGHATVSIALYGFLAVLIGREVGMRLRIAVALAAVSLVVGIAFSRLYLGVHWLSDVVAGTAFGAAWIGLLGIAYLQHAPQRIRARTLAGVAGATLIAAGSVHIGLGHASDMRQYVIRQPVQQMALPRWQSGGWADLPVRRVDLLGEYEEPFTIQWAGSLGDLVATLSAEGWKKPVPWSLLSSAEWLSPQAEPVSLPVLPRLNNGHANDLVMIKVGASLPPDERLVLRIWRSGTVLTDGTVYLPLWFGTVVTERVVHMAPLASYVREERNVSGPIRVLTKALHAAKLMHRGNVVGDPYWGGDVVLGQALARN